MWSARSIIEQLLAEGVPFAHIEAYIAAWTDIRDDDRAALWLYAWATTST